MESNSRTRRLCQIALSLAILAGTSASCQTIFGGNWWLKLDANQRDAYVWGFMMGYHQGYLSGCDTSIQALPTSVSAADRISARAGCDPRTRSAEDDVLVRELTEFYRRYPADRQLMVPDVLEQLLKGATLGQVHNYPFMRRSPATAKH